MSAADSLKSFVKGQRTETGSFDREKAIALWQQWVESLFRDVTSWLSWISEPDGSIQRVKLESCLEATRSAAFL